MMNGRKYTYQVARLAHDVGGGLLSTLPSDADFNSAEIGKTLTKYFAGKQGTSPGNRAPRRQIKGDCAATSRT